MDITTLQLIINTLNKIPVTGKESIAMMLGCINLLEKIVKEAQETSKPNEKK